MPTFRITLAYDGTDFVGWQRQAAGRSIQALLEEALYDLAGRTVTVTGAGRTDAGVHASGQVAGFVLERAIGPDGLRRALNARLPPTVRVVDAAEAPPDFHARFGAQTKTYCYRIWNGEIVSPFDHRYVWHVAAPLDVEAMDAAARLLEGRHDFAAFRAAGSATRSTERDLFTSRVTRSAELGAPGAVSRAGRWPDARLILVEVAGNGFLRHMVRNIVGTLVEVGRGRRPVAWVADVLASRDRAEAGPTAPASGLFLAAVEYGPPALAAEP